MSTNPSEEQDKLDAYTLADAARPSRRPWALALAGVVVATVALALAVARSR